MKWRGRPGSKNIEDRRIKDKYGTSETASKAVAKVRETRAAARKKAQYERDLKAKPIPRKTSTFEKSKVKHHEKLLQYGNTYVLKNKRGK